MNIRYTISILLIGLTLPIIDLINMEILVNLFFIFTYFLAGRVKILSPFTEFSMNYMSFPSKISSIAKGLVGTVGDRSGYAIECLIHGADLSFSNLNLSVGTEFVFFGGTRLSFKGDFLYNKYKLFKILYF